MNRLLALCTFALFTASGVMAQEHQHGEWCGHQHAMEMLKEEFPNLDLAAADKIYRKAINEKLLQKDGSDENVVVIPIVFHVLHENGPENIPDSQIFNAVQELNQHFRKLHPDTAETIPQFKGIHADTRIEFRLANKAPDGSCSNGINRYPSILTTDGSARVKFVQWPRHVYLNVWVVDVIPSGSGGTTLGYAFKPPAVDAPESAFLDGIVVLSSATGSIGTSNPSRGTTLAHEVGHYLNLDHPWGSTNSPMEECGDDGIEDTPESQGWSFCPNPSAADFCNPGIIENYQNFMDYTFCHTMFTEGQAAWMRTTLSMDVASRSFLSTPGAHAIAGIDQEEPTICAPKADFVANRFFACTNSTFTFTSIITNGTAESYAWSFPGGESASTDGPVAQVTYSTPGWKAVTLTVGNDSGTNTRTEEFAVYVMPDEAENFGEQFTENFTSAGNLDNRWIIRTPNQNVLTEGLNWAWSPIGCLDPGSIKVNLFDSPTREIFQIVSPRLNLEGRAGQFVSFKYAYATQGAPDNMNVSLTVNATTSCGAIVNELLVISAPQEIITGGSFPGVAFEPNNPLLWRTAIVPISQGQAVNGTQYIFSLRSDFGGNNFYIDNFTVGSSLVSADDLGPISDTRLFPNPAKDYAQLELSLIRPEFISIRVFDITGKQVKAIAAQQLSAGVNNIRINTNGLSAGVYTVMVAADGFNRSLKLMVQP